VANLGHIVGAKIYISLDQLALQPATLLMHHSLKLRMLYVYLLDHGKSPIALTSIQTSRSRWKETDSSLVARMGSLLSQTSDATRLDTRPHLQDRDCNIEPPASPYAIMRRAHPYRGENSGPGKDDRGELDIQTRN